MRRAHFVLFLSLFLLMAVTGVARADSVDCTDPPYNGLFDGYDPNQDPLYDAAGNQTAVSQVNIDGSCTFKNYDASHPFHANISFFGSVIDPHLVVFDNVVLSGNMSCGNVDDKYKIWFVNGSSTLNKQCQDLVIPVEAIQKQSPGEVSGDLADNSVGIGEPFTYVMNIPILYDPASGLVLNSAGSPNDLHTITIEDDLSAAATGADLTYISHSLVEKSTNNPVPHTVTQPTPKYYVFTVDPSYVITAGEQLILSLTAVPDATNAPGTTFVNTATWTFGRLIILADGTPKFFDPLPGENGVAQQMVITEPDLVVTKSADKNTLSPSVMANYTIDVQNIGGADAWESTISDDLPVGMCDYSPRSGPVTAQLYEADGVTAVGAPLARATDFNVGYTGCQLKFNMLTADAVIGPSQILRITYQSQLDDTSSLTAPSDGDVLTNVAGATRWYSGDGSYPRNTYSPTLSDGTPGVLDYQDSWDLTAALEGYFFQKSVTNLDTGDYPATTAFAGDTLRYTLRLTNLNATIDNIIITDTLDPAVFDLTTFQEITNPGAVMTNPDASGTFTISGVSLAPSITPLAELVFEFDIQLHAGLAGGTLVSHQAYLAADGGFSVDSDDPYVNGVSPFDGNPPPDTTDLTVIAPPGRLQKARTQPTATIGEQFRYRITVPSTPVAVPLYDVRVLDDLSASQADMQFVTATVVSGGSWALSNSGTATVLTIEDLATGIDIPANGQAVIDITVEVDNSAVNQSGLAFNNIASYTYNRVNGNAATQTTGGQNTASMSLVEPVISGATKSFSFVSPAAKTVADAATVGDVLEFVVTIPNTGDATAFDLNIIDTLPADLTLVAGSATALINGIAVASFVADPTVLPGGELNWGRDNGDASLDVPLGQSLVLSYQASVDSVSAASVSNSVYVDWTSQDGSVAAERTGSGCPTVDALNDYCFGPVSLTISTVDNTRLSKQLLNDSYAEVPASTGDPVVRVGDTATYQLRLDLQEYTTQNVVLRDVLPDGMALESFSIIASPNFNYTIVAQPAAGDTGTLTWQFGDITNTPSNDGSPEDPLYVRYVAKVVTDAAPVGLDFTTSQLLTNRARLSYLGAPTPLPARLRSRETIEVRQPWMQRISKTDQVAGRVGTGSSADPYQVDLSSDVMSFQLSSCNTGLAPAYGVVIADLLAPELDEGDLAATPPVVRIDATTLVDGIDYLYTPPARGGEMRVTLQDSVSVNPNQCVTVDYDIGFHNDLTAQTSWSNRAQLLLYKSLPLDGRYYYRAAAPAEVWMTNLVSVEPLVKSLVSLASGSATIGNEVVYELAVPGVPMNVALNNVVVNDTLNGALRYLGASAVDGNGNPVALTDNSTLPGDVNLTIANIPAGEQAIITLRTRVRNNNLANAGTSFSNSASYSYTGMPVGSNTTGTSAPLTIVEPLVSVIKGVSNTSPRAGELLTYSLDFSAAGVGAGDNFSRAFDLIIEDSLSLGLLYEPGSATLDGVPLVEPLSNGGDGITTAQSLSWSLLNGADIDIDEGATVNVSYQVRVLDGVSPGQNLSNSAIGRWSSLNGDQSAIERTGSGAPAVNDYFTAPAVVTVTISDDTRLFKRVVSDSYAEVPASIGDPVVRIGDTVNYRLILELQEGVTPNVVVEDLLPTGMALESFSITAGASFNYTMVLQPVAGATGSLRWEFGDILNTPDGTPIDRLRIDYVAKVVTDAAPVGVGNAISSILANQASLTYAGAAVPLTASRTVEVRRPRMQPVSKVDQGVGRVGTGTAADPYQINIVSDVMNFQLSSCNTGLAPAYDVLLTDLLASELDETALIANPPVVRIDGGVALTAGSDYLYTAPTRGGEMRIALQDSAAIPAGSCVTVDYNIGFHNDLTVESLWSNQAQLREYWTLPLNGRQYTRAETAEVWMTNVINVEPLTKGLLSPVSGEATIGDVVEYQLAVPGTPMNVALSGVVVTDSLNGALEYLSASAVDGGDTVVALTDNSVAPGDVSLTIASIPAGEQVFITLRTRLRNNAQANAGTSFSNSAAFSYIGMPVGTVTTGTSGPLTIVEPLVSATKAVSSTVPRAGDVLTYTVNFSAAGAGGGDNFSRAYDLSVEDSLSLGLLYVPGSASIDGAPLPEPVTNGGDGVATTQSLNWSLAGGADIDIAEGATATLSYRVEVLSGVGPGSVLSNSVTGRWTSLNGDQGSVERNGSGTPALNDYFTIPAVISLTVGDNNGLAKTVIDDSYAETPSSTGEPIVRIGDTVTYQLRLELQEGTTQNVVVEDLLPGGVALESFSISAPPSFVYAVGVQPVAGDTGTLRWELGNVLNTPSGDATPVDSLFITYVARLLTAAPPTGVGNAISSLIDNQASLNYTGAAAPFTVSSTVNVRRPRMQAITKVASGAGLIGSGTAADPYQVNIVSDVMNFQLNSCNTGQAPAYDVLITDQLAAEFDENYLATTPPVVRLDSTTLSAGVDYLYTAPARGGQMRIELQDSAPVDPGSCVTVDYSLGFYKDIAAQTSWSNQALVEEYWTLPLNGRRYTTANPAEVWMTNVVTVESLIKSLVSPVSGEATVGHVVEYQLTLPGAPMNMALDNVVVTDTLHGALEYLSATAVDGNGNAVTLIDNSVAPGGVSLNIATIPAGAQAIITLRTRVANSAQANAGTSFINSASYSYNGIAAGIDTIGSSAPLTIIEPQLILTKVVDNASPSLGDLLTYTLDITASGAGAGDDFSRVFDLILEDTLALGLLYEPGSATLDGAPLADPTDNGGDGVVTAQSLSWSPAGGIDIDLAEGQSVTVTYQARVLNSVSPGQSLSNSVVGRWSGLNGEKPGIERTGSGTPALNDYFTPPAVVTVTTQLAVTLNKSVINLTTGENPGANAEPGQILSYTLILSNDSVIAVDSISLVDELAAEFEPGTLQLVTVPAGSDTTGTNPSGGVNGTGIVDIGNISLAAQGDPGGNDSVTISFTATLSSAVGNGTLVLNQAQASSALLLPTDSNQTSTLISSAPDFVITKISEDLTRDPQILLPNESVRYTITVKNSGNEDATSVTLQDVIPSFTTYVADTTTLNGVPVADPAAGVSPLESGMLINAPEDTTPGVMRADSAAAANNVATISFEVLVDNGVLGGTFISNQAYVAGSGQGGSAFNSLPSDDPTTTAVDDPTRNLIGNLPLLDETKTVEIVTDNGTPGVADPGDVLRYTITTSNFGTVPATGVVLSDAVPANTTYVANSTTLDGAPLGQPDGGVSPLAAGVTINAAGSAAGTFDAGTSAVVSFDVQINLAVPTGTVISNQGFVASNELATEPTDADGDDSNGDQPTIFVVGTAQQLAILKNVRVVGGGSALPGSELEYEVRVTNVGTNPANSVLLTDDLNPLSAQVNYILGSATLNGTAVGVSYAGGVLSADYAAAVGDLAAGESATLRFRVTIDSALPLDTTITNNAQVEWNTPSVSAGSSVSIDVGGKPGSASIAGQAWHDSNFDNIFDATETPLVGWQVEVYLNGSQLGTLTTDTTGSYSASGMPVTAGSDQYELRFVAPGATTTTATLGLADSTFVNGPQRISAVTGPWGSLVQGLNMPIDPNGVVFDSIVRTPVAGATLSMQRNGIALPASCFDDLAQQGQVTLASGFYKFDLNFSDSACPAGGDYVINVIPPVGNDFEDGPSRIIPPVSNDPAYDLTATPYDAINCNADAVAVPAGYCEAMPSELAPVVSVTASSVRHYLYVTLSTPTPEESQLFNNHIPLDPVLDNALTISKRSPMVNVTRSQLVPYTITINNTMPVALQDLSIVDTFPPGFKYVSGSASLNGVALAPVLANGTLSWSNLTLEPGVVYTLKMLLIVGSGVSEGEYVNQVQMYQSAINGIASGVASATVRVVPDPTFDCSDIIGKVFDDKNLNGYQDEGEKGLAGTRVVSARGLIVTSDEHGRFHLTCAMVPNESRGSNYVLKLDDRSLPSGYRVTTENPRVQRLTRGKVTKFNFGATIHRVVRLDVADGVFEPGTTEMRQQWKSRLEPLSAELQKAPSVLRISYLADVEDEGLVGDRVAMLKELIGNEWESLDCCYKLTIETEIFWRRGAPPERSGVID